MGADMIKSTRSHPPYGVTLTAVRTGLWPRGGAWFKYFFGRTYEIEANTGCMIAVKLLSHRTSDKVKHITIEHTWDIHASHYQQQLVRIHKEISSHMPTASQRTPEAARLASVNWFKLELHGIDKSTDFPG